MFRFIIRSFAVLCLGSTMACNASSAAVKIPNPATDEAVAKAKGAATVVLAGGCFWGIQAVFEHVKGVTGVTAGYSGGSADTAEYETVSTGRIGHAEYVKDLYDPLQGSYGQLVQAYFSVPHEPTELDRHGPDFGSQYRP